MPPELEKRHLLRKIVDMSTIQGMTSIPAIAWRQTGIKIHTNITRNDNQPLSGTHIGRQKVQEVTFR
jgi:hypothetical protein